METRRALFLPVMQGPSCNLELLYLRPVWLKESRAMFTRITAAGLKSKLEECRQRQSPY